jgi:hypothetical protein
MRTRSGTLKLSKKADELIKGLNSQDRTYAVLHLEGHSIEEIAGMLGDSVEEATDNLERAIYKLISAPSSRTLKAELGDLFTTRRVSPEVTEVIETVRQLTPELIHYLRENESDLQKLRFDVFEHLVGECLKQRGFDEVKLVGRDQQTSADIFAMQKLNTIGGEFRCFVEVKRWKDKVGIEVVDRVYGAMLIEQPKFGWNAAMIVSLAGFTKQQKVSALKLNRLNILLKQKED